LIKFAIWNLPVKGHLKKNPAAEKLAGNQSGIKSPSDYRRVFRPHDFSLGALLWANF
jgi:hypothetical protein